MAEMKESKKIKRIVWGITGSGDRIRDTVDVMKEMKDKYEDRVDIRVYVSKAGDQVVKYYKLLPELEIVFDKIWAEARHFQHRSQDLLADSRYHAHQRCHYEPESTGTFVHHALRL